MMRYLLRTRLDDSSEWSEPQDYPTRRQRDKAASFARIIGGIRTHSYDERMTLYEDRTSQRVGSERPKTDETTGEGAI